MRRIAGWERALAVYIEAARHEPFAWGHNDCLLFATGAMRAITGVDPVDWLPAYATPQEAHALLRHYAGGGVEAALTKYLGPPLKRPLFARRGDVALMMPAVPAEDPPPMIVQKTLGVVVGAHVATPGVNAMAFLPVSQALMAWRV